MVIGEGRMAKVTRRSFIGAGFKSAAAGAVLATARCAKEAEFEGSRAATKVVPLDGFWLFRPDPDKKGEAEGWHKDGAESARWSEVRIPHTWQVMPGHEDYLGQAWYRREFDVPAEWRGAVVRVEFEAVYHTAHVWVNGRLAGEHVGKGYTAFALDISSLLLYDDRNTIAVRADNSFSPDMLPRNKSYDWAPDGGLTRPVSLLVTPPVYLEAIWVEASPDRAARTATLKLAAEIRNASEEKETVGVAYRIVDEETGLTVLDGPSERFSVSLGAGEVKDVSLPPAKLAAVKLWHFDHPHLYRLEVSLLEDQAAVQTLSTTFGVRSVEVRGTEFFLNGERVRLMGVERMAGSHPVYGMAEPAEWIRHDHDDLKNLNCVFTRVHWPQDRRVLDYCDRHGILIQVEVPTWGTDTFKGMAGGPSPAILENGLAQLREMVRRDRNHPCVFSWGLGNEVGGQDPAAQVFVRRMLMEAKRLDPGRLCSYASNSLQQTPGRDVAGDMDFIEWNEYYESWYGGTPADMRRHLEMIHAAFPGKPVVISEYGYCACTPDRPEGDGRRIEILRTHNAISRDYPWVGGLIFFCYNDYRTHIGDKGLGVMKQRVHGVVDLFGARKPSYEVLRAESGPVDRLEVRRDEKEGGFAAGLRARASIPAYPLRGYRLRWVAYGGEGLPLEQREAALPDLEPGEDIDLPLGLAQPTVLELVVDLLRPTGFSAATTVWKKRG
jgi:beta-galactosidase/beta-glucuronidase